MNKRSFRDETGFSSEEFERIKKFMKNRDEYFSKIERIIRPVIREAVEESMQRYMGPFARLFSDMTEKPEDRGLKLHFGNQPLTPIYTNSKITARDGNPIRIHLIDKNTGTIVTSGSLSSMKVLVVPLDGDFSKEDWTDGEFSDGVAKPREGRRPLVAGELSVTLQNGVGVVGDAFFTDNSRWLRSGKFRLGAKPVQDGLVREARSEAFKVLDQRGESYQKRYPPRLDDQVWRLKCIAKGGPNHKQLSSQRIETVKQFLQLYHIDPLGLRKICKDGISHKMWDAVIAHAITCIVDDGMFYRYYDSSSGITLYFNSVYELVQVTIDNQNYDDLNMLTLHQKVLVENLKKQACKNVEHFVVLNAHEVPGSSRPLPFLEAEPHEDPNLVQQLLEHQVTYQDNQVIYPNVNDPSTSTPLAYNAEQTRQVFFPFSRNSFKIQDFPSTPYTPQSQTTWYQSGFDWPATDDHEQTSTWPNAAYIPAWDQTNTFIFTPGSEGGLDFFPLPSFSVHMSGLGNHSDLWSKLRASLKNGLFRGGFAAE